MGAHKKGVFLMTAIHFGTDGWRAVVGKDFTPENIARVAEAFAQVYPTLDGSRHGVIIGFDRRNQSPEAAELIASILLGFNIPALLSKSYCPTPAVSWMTKNKGARAGIMVTASHNPPQWNGIKFKESNGGAASSEFVGAIETKIQENDAQGKKIKTAKIQGNALLERFDPFADYLSALKAIINIDAIKKQHYRIMVDPLFGAGCGFLPTLLGNAVQEIHNVADLNFGGLHPEPIPPHVNELIEKMKCGKYSCGLILDGDADRAGAVDEQGNFVTTHEVYALLILHAIQNRKMKGKIIKSISTTQMIDRIGKKFGCDVVTTPVGFRYISPAMKERGVMVGGEESGGFGFPFHVPERDGIFSNLLILEYMATTGKTLGELVADLQTTFGPTKYRRIDFHLPPEKISATRKKFETLHFTECCGCKVAKHSDFDGHHFLFDDDSWLLFRASGTEPLIRIYAEAQDMGKVDSLLGFGRSALGI